MLTEHVEYDLEMLSLIVFFFLFGVTKQLVINKTIYYISKHFLQNYHHSPLIRGAKTL